MKVFSRVRVSLLAAVLLLVLAVAWVMWSRNSPQEIPSEEVAQTHSVSPQGDPDGGKSLLNNAGSGAVADTGSVVSNQEAGESAAPKGDTEKGESTSQKASDAEQEGGGGEQRVSVETSDRVEPERPYREEMGDLLAQNHDVSDPAVRAELVRKLRALEEAEIEATLEKAKRLGVPLHIPSSDGPGGTLSHFEGDLPVYLESNNLEAMVTTNAVLVRGMEPFGVDGTGWTIGLWEAIGYPRASHQEFAGALKITIRDAPTNGDPVTITSHATHVAGTLAAIGAEWRARGAAPGAKIDAYDSSYDISEMMAAGAAAPDEVDKLRISNHSYGVLRGWSGNNWYGNFTDDGNPNNDVPKFGIYTSTSKSIDGLIFNLPYYLPFFSAGNDRSDGPPPEGSEWFLNGNTNEPRLYDPAQHPRGDGVYKGGYDLLSDRKTSKNAMIVGSVRDAVANGVRDLSKGTLSSFSSTGPTDDGRIKPDIVSNGDSLYSSGSTNDTSYTSKSGTSMASPSAAGSALLLVDLYAKRFPGAAMKASTLKGLIIHTADDLGNPGPDYQYGWGLMNTHAAAELIDAQAAFPEAPRIIEGELTTPKASQSYKILWDGSSPLRATLCWTDPAGPEQTVNDIRRSVLVNDLNLRISAPSGTVHYPYVMSYVGNWSNAELSAVATTGVNRVDNVEQVYIASPEEPGLYTVTVDHAKILTNGSQAYSLIFSGVGNMLREINLTGDLDFGAVELHHVEKKTLTVHNPGALPLSVTDIVLPPGFTVEPSSFVVEEGGAKEVGISFLPTAKQEYGGNLEVVSDAMEGNGSYSLSGTGIAPQSPQISLSDTLGFGNVPKGHTEIRWLKITNTGSEPLIVSSVDCPPGFSCEWAGGTIPVGEHHSVPIVFAPTELESYGGNVVVNSNVSRGMNYRVASGIGVDVPLIKWVIEGAPLSPNSGSTSTPNYFRISIPEGYAFARFSTSGGTGECDLYVRHGSLPSLHTWDYRSTGLGTKENIDIENPEPGIYYVLLHSTQNFYGVSLEIRLAGLADLPTVATSEIFGVESVFAHIGGTVSATGNGGAIVTRGIQVSPFPDFPSDEITSWSSGAGLGSFSILLSQLSPETFYYARAYAENAKGKGFGQVRSFTTQGLSDLVELSVLGELSFGQVTVGQSKTLELTIRNLGNSALSITSLSFPDGYSGDWNGGTIGVGGSQKVSVTFSPNSNEQYMGGISVTANGVVVPGTTFVTGSGYVAPTRMLSLSGDLAFGPVLVGKAEVRKVVLQNTGNSPLDVTRMTISPDFYVSWSGSILPGQTQEVDVTFVPLSWGTYEGELEIISNTQNGLGIFPISGTGVIDDHGDDLRSATPLMENIAFDGAIETSGDVDLFQIDVAAAIRIILRSTGSKNIVAELLNSKGVVLASDNERGGSNFQIQADVGAGTYFLRVRHVDAEGIGDYQIRYSTKVLSPIIEVRQGSKKLKKSGTRINFRKQRVRRKSRAVVFRVVNVGLDKLTGLRVLVTGANRSDFIVKKPKSQLAPLGSVRFRANFRPMKEGRRSALLTVRGGAASVGIYRIRMMGQGR